MKYCALMQFIQMMKKILGLKKFQWNAGFYLYTVSKMYDTSNAWNTSFIVSLSQKDNKMKSNKYKG